MRFIVNIKALIEFGKYKNGQFIYREMFYDLSPRFYEEYQECIKKIFFVSFQKIYLIKIKLGDYQRFGIKLQRFKATIINISLSLLL